MGYMKRGAVVRGVVRGGNEEGEEMNSGVQK